MSLDNYLERSHGSYEEMLWDFSREQIEQLYNRVRELGREQYLAYVAEHLKDILRYISLSPSQRQQKKWVNYPDGLLLRLAALQISAATVRLTDDIYGIAGIVDRGSYRAFHSEMAYGLAMRLFEEPFSLFPFEGYGDPIFS